MTKTITILGSTGSIGRQTLSVADELGLRVAALTAERNVELLEAQCRQYRPELAVLTDEAAAEELKVRLADMNIRVLAGAEALCEAAALPEADTVVVAVCGFAALRKDAGRVGLYDQIRRAAPSELENGRENHG